MKASGKSNSHKWCKKRGLEQQRFYEMSKLKQQFKDLLKVCGKPFPVTMTYWNKIVWRLIVIKIYTINIFCYNKYFVIIVPDLYWEGLGFNSPHRQECPGFFLGHACPVWWIYNCNKCKLRLVCNA